MENKHLFFLKGFNILVKENSSLTYQELLFSKINKYLKTHHKPNINNVDFDALSAAERMDIIKAYVTQHEEEAINLLENELRSKLDANVFSETLHISWPEIVKEAINYDIKNYINKYQKRCSSKPSIINKIKDLLGFTERKYLNILC